MPADAAASGRAAGLPPDVARVAARVADAVASVPGVRAVVLGGSWATGTARPDSDLDVGLLYEHGREPDLAALRRVSSTLDDEGRGDAVTEVGAWGPWIEGGGWLRVDGRAVDLLYRDVDRLERVIAECVAGRPATHYQPGHPHGFRTDIHLAEVATARALRDPGAILARLRAAITPYPPLLRAETVRANRWEAAFSLGVAQGAARSGDVHHVVGCLYRAATCLALALLAHAEVWCPNEKGAVRLAAATPGAPAGLADEVAQVLGAVGRTRAELEAALARLDDVRRGVEVVLDAPRGPRLPEA